MMPRFFFLLFLNSFRIKKEKKKTKTVGSIKEIILAKGWCLLNQGKEHLKFIMVFCPNFVYVGIFHYCGF